VTLESWKARWESFFFTPQSPLPVALFRILFGLCVLGTVLLLHGDWLEWFGEHSWVSLDTVKAVEPGVRLNLFPLLPQGDGWVAAFFWLCVLFAVLLIAGLWSRFSSIMVFLCLCSIEQRNLFLNHSGDTFLRVCGFFLMFAPAGAALSVDRLLRLRAGKEGEEIPFSPPWAQRLLQFELMLLYLASFWWKMKGAAWRQGTALYYVFHLEAVRRFPLPGFLQHGVVAMMLTWSVMALELCLGTLLWWRRVRYPLLALGLLLHLGIEYSINIPMFQWDVVAAYVLFLDPADIQKALRRITG
jgi:hypothetical protein